jgi:hypothetical protein
MFSDDEPNEPASSMGHTAMSTSTTYSFQNDLLVGERATALPRRRGHPAVESGGFTRATHVHPLAVAAAAAGYAWFLLVCWIVFAADQEMAATLFVASGISIVMLGLLAELGWSGRNVVPWMRASRSWTEFLDGRVDTFTGPMTGRAVFVHLAGMSGVLALGATAFGIIIACSR